MILILLFPVICFAYETIMVAPPTNGTFFYLELEPSQYGVRYSSIKIKGQRADLAFCTYNEQIVVPLANCTLCGVQHAVNMTDYPNALLSVDQNVFTYHSVFGGTQFQDNVVFGYVYHSLLDIPFVQAPDISIFGYFFGVTQAQEPGYISQTDGCIGLKPADAYAAEYSFLNQIENSGLIDHSVFSIHTNPLKAVSGNFLYKSYIKFGSMDTSAYIGQLSIIATTSNKEWAL